MTRVAAYGIGQGLDGRDAAMQATQKALDQLGALRRRWRWRLSPRNTTLPRQPGG